ncbi:deoxynucleotide monophosphate kinase family protein [Streptomyces sp. NPDC055036]
MSEFLIGLSGYARSGKDTAAQALADRGWRRAAFADKLREFLLALDPLLPALHGHGGQPFRLRRYVEAWGWERAKDEHPEVRALLQRAGTEAGRRVLGANVWVNALFEEHEDAPALVVSDVRFPNEAQAISDRGGVVIRVERPGYGPRRNEYGVIHESETALDNWSFDHLLSNDGTACELREKLRGVAKLAECKLHV